MAGKRKVGRPRLALNPSVIVRLAKLGATNTEIADVLSCHPDTLANNFSALLAKTRAGLRISLRKRLLRAVEREDVAPAILIFALKSICGLSEEPAPPAATVEFCVVAPSGKIPCGCIEDSRGAKRDCSICHGAGVLADA